MSESAAPDRADARSTTTLRWAVRLILAQTAVLVGVAAVLGYSAFTDRSTTLRVALSVVGYWAIVALLMGFVGMSLARGRRWSRGPAIVLELLQVPIGFGMVTGGLPAAGAPVLVVSLTAAGLLLAPATRLTLARR